jgi:hypothetical protein
VETETLCPHRQNMTRTILGGCPNCGGPKENPRHFEPQVQRGGSWLDDVPVGGFFMWAGASTLAIAVIVAIVVGWEIALGAVLVLAILFYLANEYLLDQ